MAQCQCCNCPCSRIFKYFKAFPKEKRCIINFNCDTVYYDMAHDDTTFKIVSKNDFLLIGQGRIYSVGGVNQDSNEILYFFKRKEDN